MYHRNRPDSSPRRTNAHPANAGTPQEENRQENQATQAHAGLPALAQATPLTESQDSLEDINSRSVRVIKNRLETEDYSGSHLYKYSFCGSDMRNANMKNAHIESSDLRGCDFENADLSGSTLSNCYLQGAIFNGANMQDMTFLHNEFDYETSFLNVNLNGATILDGIQHFLSVEANLDGVCIDNLDYKCGFLEMIFELGTPSRISFSLPEDWDEWTLDSYLNHHANGFSMLKTISEIDDRYVHIKVVLMIDLVKSLKDNDVDLSAPSFPQFPLMEVLMSSSVFIENETLRPFIDELYNVFNWSNILNYPIAPQVYTALLKYALNNSGSEQPFFQRNNAVFTLLALKIITSDSASDAQNIYESYLTHPTITPLVEMNTDFGDFNGRPDWDDQNAANFLLLSGGDMSSVMHISYSALTDMLNNGGKVLGWENYYLFKDRENVVLASVNKKNLFSETFPIFKNAYAFAMKAGRLQALINLLDLGEYQDRFLQALEGEEVDDTLKLIDIEHQEKLGTIFSAFYSEGGNCFSESHCQAILDSFEISTASDNDKAKVFLCLAALFTKFSSSRIFGTEDDSPQALRDYALHLMQKTDELDNTLIDSETLLDWKNRLTGQAFHCTAVLSALMINYAKTKCSDVLSDIMPPSWI